MSVRAYAPQPRQLAAAPRIAAILVSLLISAWVVWSTEAINNDAVLYLSAAKLIGRGDWAAACSLPELDCWLLYPSLIAFVGSLTTLNLEHAAYLLDACFSALMVYVFLTLVRELGAGQRILLFAAFVILMHPYLNVSRADIIRDHGYWLFYLSSLLLFTRYWRRPGWPLALAWASVAVVATLFRIEGQVFLLLLPLVLLVDTSRRFSERLAALLKVYALPAGLATGLAGWWLLDPALTVDQTGRLLEPVTRLQEAWVELNAGLEARAETIGDGVLGEHLDSYAMEGLWAMLGVILVAKVFNTLTPVYSLLLLFRRLRARFQPPAGLVRILAWLVMLNLCVLLIELLTRYVLSGRFVVPLVLVLLLAVPFGLAALFDRERVRGASRLQKWLLIPMVVTALLYMSVDGLYSTRKSSKTYLREAGYWLESQMTDSMRLYSDNDRVTWYSGQDVDWQRRASPKRTRKLLRRGTWRKYDYLAIELEDDDAALRQQLAASLGTPVETFTNGRDSILVFRITDRVGGLS